MYIQTETNTDTDYYTAITPRLKARQSTVALQESGRNGALEY